MLEQHYSFSCPFCGVELSASLDVSAGRKQQFIQDCEVCCRPFQIQVEFEGESVVRFSAEPSE